ncbi:hypothetical protein CM49_04285 [Paenibacillus sp. P1XP2]|nr:hypothetical protein CM49_04285 [Paenibacillus sp. P1XP2]
MNLAPAAFDFLPAQPGMANHFDDYIELRDHISQEGFPVLFYQFVVPPDTRDGARLSPEAASISCSLSEHRFRARWLSAASAAGRYRSSRERRILAPGSSPYRSPLIP